jgi:hypothetical protein
MITDIGSVAYLWLVTVVWVFWVVLAGYRPGDGGWCGVAA